MKPLVQNAANEEQVRGAERKEKNRREREINDLCVVLSSKEGRRFLWRIINGCRAESSVWEPSAKIHYNSGAQDVAFFIKSEIKEANFEAYQLMEKEAFQEENQ